MMDKSVEAKSDKNTANMSSAVLLYYSIVCELNGRFQIHLSILLKATSINEIYLEYKCYKAQPYKERQKERNKNVSLEGEQNLKLCRRGLVFLRKSWHLKAISSSSERLNFI